MMRNSYISGIGFNLPDKIMKNDELSKYMDTSDQWIQERSGIKERRVVERNEFDGVGPADLAIPAVEQALKMASLDKEDIDLIIFSTAMPDYFLPGSGCLLQEKMGFPTIGTLDIRQQCAGFIYGLDIADQYIKNGRYNNILFVCSEVQSTTIDYSNRGRDVAVLFGDGAGAVVLSPAGDENFGLIDFAHEIDGSGGPALCMPAGGSLNPASRETVDRRMHYVHQDGKTVFRFAVKKTEEICRRLLRRNGLKTDDVDLFVSHQANRRIIMSATERLGIENSKVVINIERYGNTTAGTVPLALADAVSEGRLKKGDLVLLASVGAGFTVGAVLLRWAI